MANDLLTRILNSPLATTGKLPERVPGGVRETGDPLMNPGVQSAPDLVDARDRKELKDRSPSLAGRIDQFLFNLGPLYEGLKLDKDLLVQFERDTGIKLAVESFLYSRPLFSGLHDWGYAVQCVAQAQCEALNRWILNQLFVVHARGNWWRPRREVITIYDPGKVAKGSLLGPDDLVGVSVYLPFGNAGRMEIYELAPQTYTLSFRRVPPPEHTVPSAQALLKG